MPPRQPQPKAEVKPVVSFRAPPRIPIPAEIREANRRSLGIIQTDHYGEWAAGDKVELKESVTGGGTYEIRYFRVNEAGELLWITAVGGAKPNKDGPISEWRHFGLDKIKRRAKTVTRK